MAFDDPFDHQFFDIFGHRVTADGQVGGNPAKGNGFFLHDFIEYFFLKSGQGRHLFYRGLYGGLYRGFCRGSRNPND